MIQIEGESMSKKLTTYRKKRDFTKTPEPKGKKKRSKVPLFVIQKHDASHLHYDFRLEVGGVLKSWAVPKGPSMRSSEKRLAMLTEDHPLEYAKFEGVIPKGEYGGGTVMVWDKGTYENIKTDKKGKIIPMKQCFEKGTIEVELDGEKLKGGFALVRFRDERHWLLIKMKDQFANKNLGILKSKSKSAKTGRTLDQIAKAAKGNEKKPRKSAKKRGR